MDESLREIQICKRAVRLYDYSVTIKNCGLIALIHQFLSNRPLAKEVIEFCKVYEIEI